MSHKVRIYPHNDLFNLANFNLKVLNERVDNEELEGIVFHCMNCLIALAFASEALINFIGDKKIKNWNERDNWKAKIKKVCKEIGYSCEFSQEPLLTLKIIKDIRDGLAHSKPQEKIIRASNKNELSDGMIASWNEYCNLEFVNRVYPHIKSFRYELLSKSGISLGQSLTSSIGRYDKA